jgi:hypothetical protein
LAWIETGNTKTAIRQLPLDVHFPNEFRGFRHFFDVREIGRVHVIRDAQTLPDEVALLLDRIALAYRTINSDQSSEAERPILAAHKIRTPRKDFVNIS